ncbi:MAG: c-type cytochrome [Geminicoccaceae bacterium]|nr:c-type cytochrome [Geminicoccaceae bacterium]
MLRPDSVAFAFALLASSQPALAEALYMENCASCHGSDRLGGMGPALLPESLSRLRPEKAAEVIRNGRPATQMPAFGDTLGDANIQTLVDLIYQPLEVMPTWDETSIRASINPLGKNFADQPVFDADPLNLFVLVEAGDHHVSILDGDTFERLARFPSHYALHGGAKFSPDGRYTYLASRDGWVMVYDLWSLQPVAEVRAGINTRNIAISHDGRYLAVANYLPHNLVILDATSLQPVRIFDTQSRVSAVYQAALRSSFIVAMKDIPELWEINYSDTPPPGFGGAFVHSHEKGMVEALPEYLPVRVTPLSEPLDDFFFDQSYRHVMGTSRDGQGGKVVNLDVRAEIADLPIAGMPHLGSGITFDHEGHRVMASPHLKEAAISIIDMSDWKLIKKIETGGPGFFMRSHANTPYAWADVFFGPNRDQVHVIDKRTLEIVETLVPAPGKTAAHVEFTRDGRYALLSIWEEDGAVVVYDAESLTEVRRIPANKPVGKYNVGNKISNEEGTSH